MRFTIVWLLIPMLSAALPASAEAPVVRAENTTKSVACDGQPAELDGNRNTITFTGSCTGLAIRGEANTVTASLAPGALIDIEGNHDRVSYHAGARPRLKISGSFTEVTPGPGSPAPAADTAVISGDEQRLTLDCHGGALTLQGTRMRVTLLGGCNALTVRGEASTVRAELAARAQILVEGNGISLVFTVRDNGENPQVTIRGMGSTVARLAVQRVPVTQATGPAPAELLPQLMHDLDGIVVKAGTLVKLPSAAFAKDGLTPAGETQMARLAALALQIRPTGLAVTARDPDPATASRRQETVNAFLRGHGLSALPMDGASETGAAGADILLRR